MNDYTLEENARGYMGERWDFPKTDLIKNLKRLGISEGDFVLDVGCGGGWSTECVLTFNPARVVGVDYSEPMIKIARECVEDERAEFIQGDISSLVLDQEFDQAVSEDVFHHLDDVAGALNSVYNLLKEGGGFFFNWSGYFRGDELISNYFQRIVSYEARKRGMSLSFPDQSGGKFNRKELKELIGDTCFDIKHIKMKPRKVKGEDLRDHHHDFWEEAYPHLMDSFQNERIVREIGLAVRKKTSKFLKKGRTLGFKSNYWLVKA